MSFRIRLKHKRTHAHTQKVENKEWDCSNFSIAPHCVTACAKDDEVSVVINNVFIPVAVIVSGAAGQVTLSYSDYSLMFPNYVTRAIQLLSDVPELRYALHSDYFLIFRNYSNPHICGRRG